MTDGHSRQDAGLFAAVLRHRPNKVITPCIDIEAAARGGSTEGRSKTIFLDPA